MRHGDVGSLAFATASASAGVMFVRLPWPIAATRLRHALTRGIPRVSSSTVPGCEPPRNQKFMYAEKSPMLGDLPKRKSPPLVASACSIQAACARQGPLINGDAAFIAS